MSNEKRGSEKLMAGCTGLCTLSPDELEQVAGAALVPSLGSYWKVFPRGIPWPEIFQQHTAVQLEQRLEGAGGLIKGY